jgi:hypothetical protein
MNNSGFIQKLISLGWKVNENTGAKFDLPDEISQRYKNIPSDITQFLSNLTQCESKDGKTWFLIISDYRGKSKSAYKWNEMELLSLEAAEDDHDWADEITNFWNNYFPFLFSAKNGYEYFAVCLNADSYGKIYKGCEPEFEEIELVADSFIEFTKIFEKIGF